MGYGAKILADSVGPTGSTHRMLSRNSASSRAIPVEKRIASVLEDPFIPEAFGKNQKGMRIAIGRCARVSYLTHDGARDPMADLELANRLEASGHMSPFEHVAQVIQIDPESSGWSGNFHSWRQYRKTIRHEDDFSKAELARKRAR